MKRSALIVAAFVLAAASVRAAEDGEDLAKQLANPVASLISVPFQSNWDFHMGPLNEGSQYKLNFQPVIPISLNRDWNLIVRTIVPFISQEDVIPSDRHQDGLGDITQSFFFSPKEPLGGVILGLGPVFLYPSATDDLLGGQKWGAGPTLVALKQTGGWTVGVLANHIWSFAGEEDRADISATLVQPFINYTTQTKTTFTLNTESTYDWNNSQWTVPINAQISQLVKIGKLPVQFTVGGRYYAEGPSGAPEWGLRFAVTLLFPTGGKPAPSAK